MRTILLIVILFIANCTQAQKETKPFVLGVVDAIDSKILGEKRVLNIYLPEGYKEEDSTGYPVIYLLDGSADEDFIHVSGLVQFNTFSWINRIPPCILVGIATVDRRRDFTTGSEKFIQFLEKELQPYILGKYKGEYSKMLIGQSLGGLLATEILLKKPNLFDKYVIVSPSLWFNEYDISKCTMDTLKKINSPISIYVGVGKEGLTPGNSNRLMEDDAKQLADKINAVKNKQLTVQFNYLPEEDHGTIMHQAVFNAFRLLYPKK